MSKHTPKPWVVVKSNGLNICAQDDEGGVIASVGWQYSQEQTDANAALIAAAPELVEALKSVLGVIQSIDHLEYELG